MDGIYKVTIPAGEWGSKDFLSYDILEDAIAQADRFGGTVATDRWFVYASPQRMHRRSYESYCTARDLRISAQGYVKWCEEHPDMPRRMSPIPARTYSQEIADNRRRY
jgi:hypothetical protein